MNKQEILFKLSDTADRLDSAGLLREAIVLTNVMKRMADVVELWDQEEPDYYYAIQGYAENSGKNNELAKQIYNEYVKDMTNLIKIPNNPNKSELTKRLEAFILHVKKINYKFTRAQGTTNKSIGLENNNLANIINNFGLERAKDLKDYNRRWQLFMDYEKKSRFEGNPNSIPPVYYQTGMQQYLANLYQQLSLKYKK